MSGRPNKSTPAPQQDQPKPESSTPRATPREPGGALNTAARFAPGQLLFAQLAGQELQAASRPHRQAVAIYPSLSSSFQVISPAMPLTRLHAPDSGNSLFNIEI